MRCASAAASCRNERIVTVSAVASCGLELAIAITDNHGMLVCYEMLDDTQKSSAVIAIEKARTSATYRRPTKEMEDGIAGGRVAILGLPGATPIDGGLPIVVGGKMIGAIGVSGVNSSQDAQIARAGLEAIGK